MTQQGLFSRGLTLLAFLLISACSMQPVTPPPIVDIEVPQASDPVISTPIPPRSVLKEMPDADIVEPMSKPIVPVSPSTINTAQRSDAVIALLRSADESQQQGDLPAAQQTLQRAQRIAPQDPAIYYRLATTHRDLQDYRLAEQVALKGVSIVQGQSTELRKFWLLIANIRLQAGDINGAEQAEMTANQY